MSNDIRKKPEGALLRTYLQAAGVAPDAMSKPLIGVATASSQVFLEKPQARELGGAVVEGIKSSGGIAVQWDTVRTPDLVSWGHAESYSFPWRDQLADLIESWARQEAVDGLVLVGDAQETLVGMAMAAARLNIPAILVTAGADRWEFKQNGETAKSKKELGDPFEMLSENLFSKKKNETDNGGSHSFNDCLLTQDDHASHAIDLVLEGLGVCLPGISTASAKSTKRLELARASGQRIVYLVQQGHVFRRFLSPNAFANAIRLNAALGGCADVAVHLTAIAHETGVSLTLDQFDRIARETPQVCRIGGVGEKEAHRIEDLDRAGGVWAILHAVKEKVLPTTTVNGKGALELAKSSEIKDSHVIMMRNVHAKQSGLGVLKGNLAPNGAVFLLNQVLPSLAVAKGQAQIFESEIEAAQAVSEGKVKKGNILFVRGQGPKGGPGLFKLRMLPALLEAKGLNKTVPVLTDGRLPDTPAGLFISHVSPEGAASGPLAVLKDGDMVEIDVAARSILVRLTEMEIRLRLARWQQPEGKTKRGFLDRYSRSVSGAHEGAVLK